MTRDRKGGVLMRQDSQGNSKMEQKSGIKMNKKGQEDRQWQASKNQ